MADKHLQDCRRGGKVARDFTLIAWWLKDFVGNVAQSVVVFQCLLVLWLCRLHMFVRMDTLQQCDRHWCPLIRWVLNLIFGELANKNLINADVSVPMCACVCWRVTRKIAVCHDILWQGVLHKWSTFSRVRWSWPVTDILREGPYVLTAANSYVACCMHVRPAARINV